MRNKKRNAIHRQTRDAQSFTLANEATTQLEMECKAIITSKPIDANPLLRKSRATSALPVPLQCVDIITALLMAEACGPAGQNMSTKLHQRVPKKKLG